jgi:hypothetical protein
MFVGHSSAESGAEMNAEDIFHMSFANSQFSSAGITAKSAKDPKRDSSVWCCLV